MFEFADKHIIFSFFALMMITSAVAAAFKALGLGVALRALRKKKGDQ